ncbi:MAG TPA: GDP-mannose 4,6-dehydratase [Candidatus Angelobacter sp.]|nr:GDP-mannose 4,6-dehydratase [Candidatus Angelobacter sp.]
MKRALITGIAGQDGSYLAEYLLTKGYKVFGLVRSELTAAQNLKNVMDKIQLLYGDLTDQLSLLAAIKKSEPDELYNLAGQPFVPNSWLSPQETINVNVGGLARLLDIVERTDRRIRVYQASSSEMFGNHRGASNEETPLVPTSPYGVSKLAAHHLCRVYRDKGVFAVGGILFNHESPRRGPEMVTRKITQHVASWMIGSNEPLRLGRTDVTRDWGFAGDYVEAMHLMLQQDQPREYVIGMGQTTSVRDFLHRALEAANIPYESVAHLISCDEHFVRENEIYSLCADSARARNDLGWHPRTTLPQLVKMMVDSDFAALSKSVEQTKIVPMVA